MIMWKDKTCKLCTFNVKDKCRRFPQLGNCGSVCYMDTRWLDRGTPACAEYKESD